MTLRQTSPSSLFRLGSVDAKADLIGEVASATVEETAEVGSECRDDDPERQKEPHALTSYPAMGIAFGADGRDDQPHGGDRPEPAVGRQELRRTHPVLGGCE